MSKVIRKVRVSEEALFTMSQKNEKEKAKYRKIMQAMNKEEKKCTENMDKVLTGTKKDLLELHAYRQVYHRHRLEQPLLERCHTFTSASVVTPVPIPGVDDVHVSNTLPSHSNESTSSAAVPTAMPSTHVRQRHKLKDPFNLRKLLDVDMDDDSVTFQRSKTTLAPSSSAPEEHSSRVQESKKRSVNRPLYGSLEYKTAIAYGKRTKQIFPGECKTHFSVKKFIEDEKNKLLDRFLPDGKKRHMLKKLAERSRFPPLTRSKTTSAIFREFRQTRENSFVSVNSRDTEYSERSGNEQDIMPRIVRPKDLSTSKKRAATNRVKLLNLAKQTRRMSTVL